LFSATAMWLGFELRCGVARPHGVLRPPSWSRVDPVNSSGATGSTRLRVAVEGVEATRTTSGNWREKAPAEAGPRNDMRAQPTRPPRPCARRARFKVSGRRRWHERPAPAGTGAGRHATLCPRGKCAGQRGGQGWADPSARHNQAVGPANGSVNGLAQAAPSSAIDPGLHFSWRAREVGRPRPRVQ
jgi:hypothetical protein